MFGGAPSRNNILSGALGGPSLHVRNLHTVMLTLNIQGVGLELMARSQFDSDSQSLGTPETIDFLQDPLFKQPRQSCLLRGTIPRPPERNNGHSTGYGMIRALAGTDPRICKRRI